MKINGGSQQNWFANNDLVRLKNQDWLEKQRVAGRVAAGALSLLEQEVKNGTTKSLLELDILADQYIRDHHCSPTFYMYKGFPNSVCISVNQQLVHGIPTNYHLQDGDIVSFDLGATNFGTNFGCVGDTALTTIYGQPKNIKHQELIKATKEALTKGIEAIKIGNQIGCIGEAIYKCGRSYGLAVVDKYGGHGICSLNGVAIPHASPFISNKASSKEGIRIVSGMTIAIEPLFVIGTSNKTTVSDDGWTVNCENICSHEEHTIFIHEDYVEIITDRSIL
jgi:methionyl aminopeptidase